MFSPPPLVLPNMPVIFPALSPIQSGALPALPASGTWVAASRLVLFPLVVYEPFTVAKAFWCNGATVGTDSIDVGVYQMTDLATGRCDLIRSTGAVLSAGTASVVQEVSAWKVARANLTSGSDSTDSTTYTTASVTLKAGRLYLMSVENSKATADVISSIDNGPTFVSRSTVAYNTNANRVSIWSAVPTTDYTGTLVINFGGGNTQTGACWALDEMSGVDTTTNHGIVQNATGTGNSGTALATLGAFGSANNATYGAHGHAAATASTPGSGFTELSDVTAATPAQALCTDWRVDNDTTVDATFTSAQWGSCAVEIKADASSFIIPPTGDISRIYMGMSINGTTATIIRQASGSTSFSEFGNGFLIGGTLFPLPSSISSISPSAATTFNTPLAGFSSRSLIG